MNNQRAIDRLTKHLEWGWSKKTVDAIERGIHALKETQWIPCSERMPKERDSMFARWKGTDKWTEAMFEKRSDTVIATIEYSNGKRTVAPAYTTDGKWRCDCIIGDDGEVIAWMPLPEPYKEEKQNDK
ncbi:DUF551 domain-containing protein [Dorea sp. Marseille-P4042]|uniref:DUF551 domain-containing protein n=1 Tax=Dorea sp. Marseille-P4042 TaxID=2080749 RepID=UPI000CF85C21|nr:DUF551 domain-containing protein [Dorea sp. Marseille-P4042]